MYKSKINQIKVILGLQVKLAADKLIDGTAVEAEKFEPGFELFVVNEDGTKSPAPAGKHETESGVIVEVDQEGRIVSAEAKESEAQKVEVEVEAAKEDMVPASKSPKELADEQAKVDVNMAAFEKILMAIEEISSEMAKVKTKMSEMEAKYQKFEKSPGAAKFPRTTAEVFEAGDTLEHKIAVLNQLKGENFFKIK